MTARVAALGDQLVRHLRAATALKTALGRGEDDAERAVHTVLFALTHLGPARAGTLAERLGTDPSTTSRQTAELVRRGLLERRPDPSDGRASLLALTPAGTELVDTLRRRRNDLVARAVDGWSEEDVTTLTRLLERLSDGLDEARADLLGCTAPPTRFPGTSVPGPVQDHRETA
ncbi:MarR family winged helix-turn-helix transcriptional regulator [Kineococcus terrestris]|uniref:MarR family winged helix-turn-helix transcriptional regulator n=1 Tax=Kineococcus terrestris TaxID=2044856 RepID=UPI0034DB6A2B